MQNTEKHPRHTLNTIDVLVRITNIIIISNRDGR